MKYSDIPVLDHASSTNRAQDVRQKSRRYVQSVIEDSRALPSNISLNDLQPNQLSILTGGKDAATYLLLHKQGSYIIKFGSQGLEAEAETLRAWAEKSVRVPRVYSQGVVPVTRSSGKQVSYIIEEALVDKHGRLAETAEAFLEHAPDEARHVGRLMGKQLARAHGCISDRSFGDFADSDGNTAAYASWNNYLSDYFATQEAYLRKIGVSPEQYTAVQTYISQCNFVKRGRYLHGDFSVRNTAIQPYKDSVVLFDPNPVIGDPSWDIAVLYNNAEYAKHEPKPSKRDQQVLIGFKQGYSRQISIPNVLAAQLVQSILHTQYHEAKVTNGKGDKQALAARQTVVMDLLEQICQKVNNG